MRRTLRKQWLPAVLGGLAGLTGTTGLGVTDAVAQTPADRYVAKQAALTPVDPGIAKRGEFECALLADPLTFPYPLQAIFHDNTLEIHGAVPSLAVRERVLTLAGLVHHGAISDRIEVELSSARRIRPESATTLHVALMQRLHAAFPQLVANIRIHCDDRGNVTIDGSVPTWTEKRTIHQTLRDTPGCASMANHLTLTLVQPRVEGIVQAGGVPLTGGVVPAGFSQTKEPGTLESQRAADSAMRIEDAILHLCPQAKNLHVVHIEPKRYRIEIDAPDEETGSVCVGRIFRMEELRRFQIDVLVNTPKP
jgi:BON domain-containing protein